MRAIVGLGRQLGIAVTADGVETLEQLHAARNAGCGEAQGAWFGRPKAAAELSAMLAQARIGGLGALAPSPVTQRTA